jgi:amino acid adenylation domain-containing protein
LFEWNETAAEFPQHKCVHEIFEEQVARTPDAVAVVFEEASLTYGELNSDANRLAHSIRSFGGGPEARVAICLERSLEMVVALLAVLKSGCAYVPLDPTYPLERLSFMLEDSGAVALLTKKPFARIFAGNQALKIVDLTAPSGERSDRPITGPNPIGLDILPSHLAYVIYTSGSTGKPKGVMVEHRSIVNRLVWMQRAYGLNANDTVLQKTPFSFDVSVWEFFWPLMAGARLVMARPEGHKDPAYLIEIINRSKVTTAHFVPSMLDTFLDQANAARCLSLIRIISSGEALPAALARRFSNCFPLAALHNLYGPTETTVDVTAWTYEPDPALTSIPIGRPIMNTRVYILDADGEPVPVGEAGELYIGGAGVARGYLNRPELTAERFLADPFCGEAGARMFRSGDLCRWRSDGNIEYLGRNDFQVKIRGFRVELGEIEARLTELATVRAAVVAVCEDKLGDKRLVAYLVPATGAKLRDGDLRDALGGSLPDYMVPHTFIPLERMPVTANGKLDRAALPAPSANNQLRRENDSSRPAVEPNRAARNGVTPGARANISREANYVPPSDTLEVQLIEIWEEVLGVPRIGVRDDFFLLGGHSLRAARMFARIGEKLRRNIPLATLFQAATIEKLAQVIREEGWTPHWSVLVPIREHGAKPPLFLVHGLYGNVLNFYGFRHHIPSDQPLYGIQATGLDSGRATLVNIPDMAAHYIKEIRSVQPTGPYFLGGFSAGGLVAYEMARQLVEAGERVQLLALFDSYVEAAGGYWLKSFYSRRALRMSLFALRASLGHVKREGVLAVFLVKLRSMGVNLRIMLWHLLGRIAGRGRVSDSIQPQWLSPLEAFTRAIRVYAPQPYSGSAVLFRNPDFDFETHDVSEGWTRYVTGKLVHKEIYAGHDDIFREPHIASLAGQLMEALDASYDDLAEQPAEVELNQP